MAKLLDVNVLFALLHPRHSHTARALEWLRSQDKPGGILLCRITQMGALRLLTRPSVMREDLLSPADFWEGWERVLADRRFEFFPEPRDFEPFWRETTRGFQVEAARTRIVT